MSRNKHLQLTTTLKTHNDKRSLSILIILCHTKTKPLTGSSNQGFFNLKPGSVLLSHGEAPHYHRRCIVSLPSSKWDRVVPTLYCRQANCFVMPLFLRNKKTSHTTKFKNNLEKKCLLLMHRSYIKLLFTKVTL